MVEKPRQADSLLVEEPPKTDEEKPQDTGLIPPNLEEEKVGGLPTDDEQQAQDIDALVDEELPEPPEIDQEEPSPEEAKPDESKVRVDVEFLDVKDEESTEAEEDDLADLSIEERIKRDLEKLDQKLKRPKK